MGENIKLGKRFEGKVAIVTASTKGIGLSIAHRLGLEGASVVISSRSQENVEAAVEKLKAKAIQVSGVVCHVSNPEHRKNLIQHTIQKYGKIDVIISNAGVNPSPNTILNTSQSALDKVWDVNVKANVLLLQEAAPHLRKGSSIVFMSSLGAYQPMKLLGMYAVTKAALVTLTKALAREIGPDIRVNCIAPGYVLTDFSGILTNTSKKDVILRASCLKRAGTPEEVAASAAFLASEDASYITGETLLVAGGVHARL